MVHSAEVVSLYEQQPPANGPARAALAPKSTVHVEPSAPTRTLESEVRLYSRHFPVVFDEARGAELFAEHGKRYLDFLCGAGALNYGHNHPAIKAPVVDYLAGDGVIHALDTDTVTKRTFLERFDEVILRPRDLSYKIQFPGPTGTNAVEASLKLARKATGRTGMVAFSGSFHGMTTGSMAVSANVAHPAGVPVAQTTFVPFPEAPLGHFDSIGYLERLWGDPCSGVERPAAVIVEPVQMDGGIYVPSEAWLRSLRALTTEYDVLLICDEVQIGCGRAGTFFCFEQAGITPDIVVLSKSLSGLGLPLSLNLIRPELDVWDPGEHTGTFRANQLSLVAATAAVELWDDGDFVASVGERSLQLVRRLAGLAERHPVQFRHLGMAAGLESCGRGSGWTKAVQAAAFERGLIIETCGRDDCVVKVCPPLTITPDELDEGCRILGEALSAAGH